MQIKSSDPNHPGSALPLMDTLHSLVFGAAGEPHSLAPCPWSRGSTWALGQSGSKDAENQESPGQWDS